MVFWLWLVTMHSGVPVKYPEPILDFLRCIKGTSKSLESADLLYHLSLFLNTFSSATLQCLPKPTHIPICTHAQVSVRQHSPVFREEGAMCYSAHVQYPQFKASLLAPAGDRRQCHLWTQGHCTGTHLMHVTTS